MKKLNQNGFSGVEVLLLLIFLAIVGFAGYYVYHAQKTSSPNKNDTANTTAKPTTTKKAATSPSHTAQEAVGFVQATYDTYLAAEQPAENNPDMQPTGAEGLPSIKDNMTADAYAQVTSHKGGSGFTCTMDQSVPASVTTALSSSTDTQAVVAVSTNGNKLASVSVDLSALKITAINCVMP